MEHSAKNEPKLLHRCNLPLTGAGVVDMVITDLGVFTIDKHGNGGMQLADPRAGSHRSTRSRPRPRRDSVSPKLKH